MKGSTTKTGTTTSVAKKSRKAGLSMLSTCPTNQAGWCAYPFSPEQLAKRMRAKAKLDEIEETKRKKTRAK
ncbi:MAG: hypothetical protein K8F91_02815 [Candidatus Obscuribacterales bacterium]|nr:hypothetical protein [Candidatus Obscuribacterales bacterium]